MKIETTFVKLHEANACQDRYKHLARKLGGITKYGENVPISLLQILDISGINDALWALCACELNEEALSTLRLFACDCTERALKRERKAGREPDKRSWDAITVARRFALGRATKQELNDAAANAAYAANAAAAAYAAAYAAAAANAAYAAAYAAYVAANAAYAANAADAADAAAYAADAAANAAAYAAYAADAADAAAYAADARTKERDRQTKQLRKLLKGKAK